MSCSDEPPLEGRQLGTGLECHLAAGSGVSDRGCGEAVSLGAVCLPSNAGQRRPVWTVPRLAADVSPPGAQGVRVRGLVPSLRRRTPVGARNLLAAAGRRLWLRVRVLDSGGR